MSHILNTRERAALDKLSFDRNEFVISGKLVGIGKKTLDSLIELGLIEAGRSTRYDQIGWRVTADGWRCMYGKTYEQIRASSVPSHPLKIWRWPPA